MPSVATSEATPLSPAATVTDILWTPVQISTVGWYDASDSSTITESSNNVSQWNDKSGNARHLVQGNGALQPVTNSDTINSLNTLTFTAANTECMSTAAAATWLNGTKFHTFVIVEPAVATDSMYWLGTNEAANNRGLHIGHNGNTNIRIDFYNDANDIDPFTRGTVPIMHNWSYLDPGSDYYKNGTKDAGSSATHPQNDLSITTGGFAVGCGWDTSSATWNGEIAEVVILTGAMTTATRQLIEGYLAWKWGLQASLPAGHPYLLAPPTL